MKLLVVEDDYRIAQTIRTGLEQERHTVDLAHTGPEGYDLAVNEDYDIVILDLMLPKMDGIEICKKLRSEHIQTPILMLTAKSQIHDKVAGLNAGADDYLTKPFSFEELLARIRALKRRKTSVITSDILMLADLTLNTQTFDVKRGDERLNLSGKEFAFLEYLMRNPNKILKKENIITHVWDYDANILPNTIEVYIKNLRNKIDSPFKNKKPLIHTVRGFGYKIGE